MPNRPTVSIRFSAAEIATRVDEMATELAGKLAPDTLVVSVLKGSFVFAADLIRALSRAGADWSMDFVTLSSYGTATETTGSVKVVRDIIDDVRDRDVLLVDDILESGYTLSFAKNLLLERGAKRVSVCTLLDKPGKRRTKLDADFVGFQAGDEFLVGYGLDWAHRFRGLPYIGVVEKAA
ncbi:MAG: hypoxanthine phosphoribosyltransferase [Reyranella sp.]|mgnify:FL=1|jgi:hypoxanthine phosphoribosyltransferase|uniref:hypoxanthine phosphoribosyltransferase n=1 Tax=Reyranella sp. TaxID=1929291 RepID=UPI00096781D4|nr:hypoxanthine phosphoribosyltransferase [Reyranella sp.]MBN9537039.1 hypoxanthine phosphoribosyltransferase [Alphaproteobacteria bacterium]MBR2814698.1 hypoxanthine phosphoribosyltransferase [Reyranella sp.]OJU32154.1 MAG: hypoxanthine phosphoribosyltransferase [Alphaproteobacteria bacterium 65-37]